MRILLIGQAAFGAKVLESLLERNENIIGVYAPPDRPGGRTDPLKDAAVSKGIDVFQPATYKDDQIFAEYKELKPDLTVMAFVTDIIPARFFEVPTHGTINYHPSILPRHRGASAINWAVIMGDTRTGLSIFWPDGGIDTGLILLQKEIEIGPDDTTGALYFNHLFPMGVDAILESIDLIKAGKAPKIPQDEAGATYEPPCDDQVAGIDWDKPAGELYNLVRGCDPQPGAFALFKGEKVRFYGAQLIEETTDKAPGTILAVDDQGIHVAVSGARLVAGKVRPAKGKKVAAAEFATEQGLKAGDMFDK
ncbi:MAG: methionyl-tRNA formyltransferase [Deltaproteobacteria bacterium]|nr:methionyl-tRNA formyltransferase [Deltaproteobacteria bacterium]OQY12508.1 MAG: methionyl-tRNA formyltransferase [Desulfobacteraceae bacterium 4572_187]